MTWTFREFERFFEHYYCMISYKMLTAVILLLNA